MNYNIAFLRNIAIIAIVIHHSICIYHGWPPNTLVEAQIPEVLVYVSLIFKIFGLSVFTFISGYVLYYQINKIKSNPKLFLFNKAKRIILPCVAFGLLYRLLFPCYMYEDWPSFINGTHLWYLPMLFICIVISSFLTIPKYGALISACLYVLLIVVYKITGLRTLNECFLYMPTFMVGFFINKYNIKIHSLKHVLFVLLIFIISLFGEISFPGILLIRMMLISISVFLLLKYFWNNKPLGKIGIQITSTSFSIYLLHQFFINFLLHLDILNYNAYYFVIMLVGIFSMIMPMLFDRVFVTLKNKFIVWVR